jgi:hypothetical protein
VAKAITEGTKNNSIAKITDTSEESTDRDWAAAVASTSATCARAAFNSGFETGQDWEVQSALVGLERLGMRFTPLVVLSTGIQRPSTHPILDTDVWTYIYHLSYAHSQHAEPSACSVDALGG